MSTSIHTTMENTEKNRKLKPLKLAAILGALGAFAPLSIDMYLPGFPEIAKDLHTSQTSIQLSLTFFLFGMVLGQLLVGPLSDSLGRKRPLIIGLVLYSLTSIGCIFAPNVGVFITLRFLQGFSGASGIVLSRAILRDFFSGKELTKIFALLGLVQGAAPILAPVLGGIVLLFAPWQGVFIFLGIFGFLMFFIVSFMLPESLDESRRTKGSVKQTFQTFKRLFVDVSFIGFALVIAFQFSMMFAYISSSSFVFQNIYGVSPQMFSLIFAINGMGIVTCSQIAGRLVGRVNELKLLITGIRMAFFSTILLLVLLILQANIYFVLIPLFFAISSFGIVSTTGQSLALQKQGKVAGSASALLGVLQYVTAGSIGPLTGIGSLPAVSMGVVMVCGSIGAVLSYLFIVRRSNIN